jgi:hypothetical protein
MGRINQAADQLASKFPQVPRTVAFELVVGALFAVALFAMLVVAKGSLGLALVVASVVLAWSSEWLIKRNSGHAIDLIAIVTRAAPGVVLGLVAMVLGITTATVQAAVPGV